MYDDHAPRVEHEATCSDCGTKTTVPFVPREGRPVRCRDCFDKSRPSGGDRRGGDRRDRAPREEHEVTCAECGTQTTVPFKPTSDRPVLCRDCFKKAPRPQRTDRPMHEATCTECGKTCEVPFKPTPGKAVRCNDCFRR